MWVYLNKYSNNGRGYKRWLDIKSEFDSITNGKSYNLVTEPDNLHQKILKEYNNGERIFVAAGGDGTVNLLLNEIMMLDENVRGDSILGAIGLGSSNDFHKPLSESSFFAGKIPYKLNHLQASDHNIAKLTFDTPTGITKTRYFIINGSIGIVANANFFFNNNDRIIKHLKPRHVGFTILYAGLKSIINTKNIKSRIYLNKDEIEINLSNLSFLIKPNFSGNFRYDLDVDARSDHIGVALCEDMGVVSRARTIYALSNGRFNNLPHTRTWMTDKMEIEPVRAVPLEYDGEVALARNIKINLIKGGIKVCK